MSKPAAFEALVLDWLKTRVPQWPSRVDTSDATRVVMVTDGTKFEDTRCPDTWGVVIQYVNAAGEDRWFDVEPEDMSSLWAAVVRALPPVSVPDGRQETA